jgi:hypothetical protein
MLMRRNLSTYIQGALLCRTDLIPTEAQIRAATLLDARMSTKISAEGGGFCAKAVEICATRTKEEEMVQELLKDWQKGAHRYIPEGKEDNVIRLGCENVNSLSNFYPTKSKMRKLINLRQRYQTDGACIVEHEINCKMASTGTRPEDLFPGGCSNRFSVDHNIHESHTQYQQGGTMTVAFSWLASYVILTGVDQTGLGWWS